MASPERKISAVPPAGPAPFSGVDARLASLEDEALRLRAEIAALQDDIRWLSGDDDEAESRWLARGWVRASLLLTTVGVVAIVSLPYLLHHDPVGADRPPTATARPARAVEPVAQPPIPAPVRVRETVVPAPARILSTGDRPVPAPQPRLARERRDTSTAPDPGIVTAPLSHENSP